MATTHEKVDNKQLDALIHAAIKKIQGKKEERRSNGTYAMLMGNNFMN